MVPRDEEFLKTLLAAFREEAGEHLQAMSAGLLALEQSPGPERGAALLESVYREAHSLKGAARAVGRADVEGICQELETLLASWKRQEWRPDGAAHDALQRAVDAVARAVAAAKGADAPAARAVAEELRRLRAAPAEPAPVQPVEPPAPAGLPPAAAGAPETVRVATAKLDTLMLDVEALLAVKVSMAQRAADARSLRDGLESWLNDWAGARAECLAGGAAGAGRLGALDGHAAAVKGLAARLEALACDTERDRRDVSRSVDSLLDSARTLLMLPCSALLGLLPKLVRDLCHEQGKEAEVVVLGGEVEIDKRVLQEMKDPLIHLVRNSVDHGVEPAAERARLRKPARATIRVSVAPVEGDKVEIVVSDDGAGIDLERTRAAAVRQGVVSEAEAAGLTDGEALGLVFVSGVSTAPAVSAVSGRGLGMAIVQQKVEQLGGRLTVETRRGEGTSIRALLPVALATFRGVLVEACGRTFAIPSASVERVGRVREAEVRTVQRRETIALGGRALALSHLGHLLELPPSPGAPAAAPWVTFLVLGAGERRLACVVDAVLEEAEMLVKRLPKPLARVRNVAGATVLGTGRVVPVLHVADLIDSACRRPDARRAVAPAAAARKAVLVVEDSITSRMLLKNVLELAGYRVGTAADGVDALSRLRAETFDAVVSDVDMPRMDGVLLTRRIRAEPRIAETPVILVTALGSREDRERGMDAGANAYIVKSRFDQGDLVDALRRLAGGEERP